MRWVCTRSYSITNFVRIMQNLQRRGGERTFLNHRTHYEYLKHDKLTFVWNSIQFSIVENNQHERHRQKKPTNDNRKITQARHLGADCDATWDILGKGIISCVRVFGFHFVVLSHSNIWTCSILCVAVTSFDYTRSWNGGCLLRRVVQHEDERMESCKSEFIEQQQWKRMKQPRKAYEPRKSHRYCYCRHRPCRYCILWL